MGGPENGNFPLLYVVKMSYVGGWVVQKILNTPLRNIKMAPNHETKILKIGTVCASLYYIHSFMWS